LAPAAVTVARPAPTTTASGCARAAAMKAVFPKAETAGFDNRWEIARVGRRHPYFRGWCGNWRTTYTDYRGGPGPPPLRPYPAFAEVLVSLYKTRRGALDALAEPGFGSIRILPNGVRMRTSIYRPNVNGDSSREGAGVASVVGNVFISSGGQGRPPAYQRNEALRAQVRIHRYIHAAVLRSG